MRHHFDGTQLRRLREQAGLQREHLAIELGRTAETIAAYEGGKVDPPASAVAKLAAAIGCTPGDLFTEQPVVVAS